MNDDKFIHFRIPEDELKSLCIPKDEIDVGHFCLNTKPITPDRLIFRNFDGSEAIIPADLLPEELRDGRQDVDAVNVVKHLVNKIRNLEKQNGYLADNIEILCNNAAKDGRCPLFWSCPAKKLGKSCGELANTDWIEASKENNRV